MRNVIRSLSPVLPISVEAPSNVETVITHDQKKRRFIVHFVSYTGPRDGNAQTNPAVQILGRSKLQTSVPFMEESLIYRAQVNVRSDFNTASALGAGSQVRRQGKRVILQSQQVHDTLVIGY